MGIARQIVADDRRIVANGLQIVAKRSKETPTIKSLLGTIFAYAKNKYYGLLLVDGLLALMYKFTDCSHLCYKNVVGLSLLEIQ